MTLKNQLPMRKGISDSTHKHKFDKLTCGVCQIPVREPGLCHQCSTYQQIHTELEFIRLAMAGLEHDAVPKANTRSKPPVWAFPKHKLKRS